MSSANLRKVSEHKSSYAVELTFTMISYWQYCLYC
jgi:hypothetical protein